MSTFDDFSNETARTYLDFLLWHYRVVDAFWYLNIEKEKGTDEANFFNEKVWERVSGLAAREIKKRFDIKGTDLDAFVAAQKLFPWHLIVNYEIVRNEDEVLISVPDCPTQKARLARGLSEYACKEMHQREFVAFAQEINPEIKVECIHAPLDPHPPERFCQWRFTLTAK
jgi:hypothetical protein